MLENTKTIVFKALTRGTSLLYAASLCGFDRKLAVT